MYLLKRGFVYFRIQFHVLLSKGIHQQDIPRKLEVCRHQIGGDRKGLSNYHHVAYPLTKADHPIPVLLILTI